VRDCGRLKVGAGKVSVAQGNAVDEKSVRAALSPDFDAVLNAIGESALKPSTVATDSVHAILAGMKQSGIARYMGVSGVAEMPNKTTFGNLTISFFKITPVGHPIRDHDRAFEELKRSGLEWTLAGCGYIKDGPRRGGYKTSLTFDGGFKVIHPPDVADLLVRELSERKFPNQVVGIWY
jgi:putative NADH-flavin reductase